MIRERPAPSVDEARQGGFVRPSPMRNPGDAEYRKMIALLASRRGVDVLGISFVPEAGKRANHQTKLMEKLRRWRSRCRRDGFYSMGKKRVYSPYRVNTGLDYAPGKV